jgi:hypothetical protein
MSRARITFLLGWASVIAGFVYKALTFSGAGLRVANSTGVSPRHFIEASLLMFVICIAEVVYASLGERKPETGAVGAKP